MKTPSTTDDDDDEVARRATYKRIYLTPTGGAARKRPVPGDVGFILQRVAAIPERISMGFRHGFPLVFMGFRGFPLVSGAILARRAHAACGNSYGF